jgi:hypothetical protein
MAEQISRAIVNRYIEAADAEAQSEAERLAVRLASRINSTADREAFRFSETARTRDSAGPLLEVESWKRLILRELHTALCTRKSQYKNYRSNIEHGADLLIVAIATEVGTRLGVSVAVVAALVAALLRMGLSMGGSVFCKVLKASLR